MLEHPTKPVPGVGGLHGAGVPNVRDVEVEPALGAGGPAVPPPGNVVGGALNQVAGGPPVPQLGDHIIIAPPSDFEAEAQRVPLEVARNHEAEQVAQNVYNDTHDYQHLGIYRLGMAVWPRELTCRFVHPPRVSLNKTNHITKKSQEF